MAKLSARILIVVAVLTISAGVTGGAMASDQWAVSGSSNTDSAVAGETVDLTFTTTHEGNQTTSGVLRLTDIPKNWSVNGTSGDGYYNSDKKEILYISVPANGTVSTTVSLSIPDSASPGEYQVTGIVADENNTVVGRTNVTVTVGQQLRLDAGTERLAQGKSGSVGFTVSNDGDSAVGAAVNINRSSIPASWNATVEGSGELKVTEKSYEILYLSIPADGAVTSELHFEIPDDADVGTYNISASVTTDGTTATTSEARVTVTESVTEAYDKDENGSIETNEVLTAVSDWEQRGLSTSEILEIVAAWASS